MGAVVQHTVSTFCELDVLLTLSASVATLFKVDFFFSVHALKVQ